MDQAGMPPEAAPAPAGGEGKNPQDQFTDLVGNISDGMAMLTDVMGQIDPDSAAELGSLSDQFKAVIEKAMSGGQGAAPAQSGQAPAMVGGAKAVPASPAGIPRG